MTQLLNRRSSHGYELVQRLRVSGFVDIGGGTLYPLLHRLEGDAAVEWVWEHPSAGPARKRYSLTESGERLTAELICEWNALSRHMAVFLDQSGSTA